MNAPPIVAILGPTGVGKTSLSLRLAARWDGEIVSADSRQVFRQLTIGTAKPTLDELAHTPHHFINELNLTESFSAGRFAAAANARIEDILKRGRTPIVVGGSTLYVEALIHGIAEIPPTSVETRQHLMGRLEDEGAASLFDELSEVDPTSAATMDPTKSQRIVRALEVFHDLGKPLSVFHASRPAPLYSFRPFVLDRPRAELYERINTRVDAMLDAGLVEENRRLLEANVAVDSPPLRTIGYREPMAYLRGELTHTDMVARLKRNTRRYAKRQLTWFRRHDSYTWIDVSQPDAEDFALQ